MVHVPLHEIGGADADMRIIIKPESQQTVRIVAAALSLCIFLAFVFLPFMQILNNYFETSIYEVMEFVNKHGWSMDDSIGLMFLSFVSSIILYAAAARDKGKVKPIIALVLVLIPLIKLLSEDARFGNWVVVLFVLYFALAGLTVAIVANSRKPAAPDE